MKISEIDLSRPIIVLGTGGHAKVVIEALLQAGREIIGVTEHTISGSNEYYGVKILGNDDVVDNYLPTDVVLVNGVGSMPDKDLRREINNRMEGKGFQFTQVIHPSSIISSDVNVYAGVQIMAGVVVQPGVSIGKSSVINTGSNVDHDCVIHDNCHLAPSVTLSGNVVVKNGTHIGTGTSVIQGISIGSDCIVAAGSIIHHDIPDKTKYIQPRDTRLEGKI